MGYHSPAQPGSGLFLPQETRRKDNPPACGGMSHQDRKDELPEAVDPRGGLNNPQRRSPVKKPAFSEVHGTFDVLQLHVRGLENVSRGRQKSRK